MTLFERWFLRRIFKREVRQGELHTQRIAELYAMIREACNNEFTEDNSATLDAYLQGVFSITQAAVIREVLDHLAEITSIGHNMDDKTQEERALLELAAKAAGMRIRIYDGMIVERGTDVVCVDENGFKWNPLTDDGDALRLAVRLRMTVHIDSSMTEAINGDDYVASEAHLGNPCAATRRAIVRAAAKIAEQQTNGGSNGA